MDHTAQLRRVVHRIAKSQRPGALNHQRHKPIRDTVLNQDAFHRRAALPGILGGPGDRQIGGGGQIVIVQIVQHDQRVIPAQFQNAAFIARFGRNHLSNRHPAGECHQFGGGIHDHFLSDVTGQAGDHRQHFGRQPGLIGDVGQNQRGHRRQLGRFGHHAIVGGNRRRNLVRDHVQGMVERRDRGNRAQRFPHGENAPLLSIW